jgi:hypothetical protein
MLLAPFRDVLRGLDRCLERGAPALAVVLLGLLAGWWLYVPIHELLHAAGCLAAGGRVDRLEIDGVYGGALLARIFPFVVSGSQYAGRLSGFDTRGNDWIYLGTDLAPFVLTLPGVWLLRRAASSRRAFFFGLSLPFALAPFLSLTGDAYEIGSILVTHLPPWQASGALRGDDLLRKGEELARTPGAPWGGFILAVLFGLLWAFLTAATARSLAKALDLRSER